MAQDQDIRPDTELERLASSGDEQAFGVLYERHIDAVHDYVLRMVKDEAEAADLAQDTFVRAFRALDAERAGAASFRTFLFTIAYRLYLNRVEKMRRTVSLVVDDEDEAPLYYAVDKSRVSDPELVAQVDEVASLVWEATTVLSPRDQSVLHLHLRQGLESAEIASVLGVNAGNAYTIVSRAKSAFEDAFAALVMMKRGRQRCADLDGLLRDRAQAYTHEIQRLIERHLKRCDICQEEKRRRLSPAAILPLFGLLAIPLALRRHVAEAAWQEICTPADGGVGGPPGPGSSASLLATGASLLQRAPGTRLQQLGGVAAAILVLVSAGVCVKAGAGEANGGGGDASVARTSTAVAADQTRLAVASNTRVGTSQAHSPMPPTPSLSPTAASTPVAPATAEAIATIPAALPTDTATPSPGTAAISPCGQPGFIGAATVDSSYAGDLLTVTNQYRAQHNQAPLTTDPALLSAADSYARFVAESGWTDTLPADAHHDGVLVRGIHIDANCHDMYDRAISFGYPPLPVGENVLYGSGITAQQAFDSIFSYGGEDPARLATNGSALFVHVGIACYQQPAKQPVEFVCVQVLGG